MFGKLDWAYSEQASSTKSVENRLQKNSAFNEFNWKCTIGKSAS